MYTLHIPANYDVWLTGLKHHLDRRRGSKSELARLLARSYEISEKSAVVKLVRILNGQRKPEMEVFFDIAAWLQRRQDAQNDPPVIMPLAAPSARPEKATPLHTPTAPAKAKAKAAD